ncbi:uncharacterized protein N7482_004193 [Penicillium canariense]|uniref:Protein kinase domain-containing protein n=1 Tax=Penicillium canariense TaxID=189055 RepID=A0A9W9I5Y1_9EURO|nr:uncharacterized protein N7482_004193 [Penicillium canariense]KAJ5168599.1 hypothetical protein N7482_004193 [Penicillium canariense]
MEQIVSFVPDSLRTAWLDSDRHLTTDGLLRNPFPEDERELPLAEAILEVKPEGMGDDEATAFIEFMSLGLRFEPAERSSAQQLLQHRWATDWGDD